MITLGELVQQLAQEPQDRVLRNGFHNPHSYRGDYCHVAFEPRLDVKIGDMLRDASSAIGETYEGWKGGLYKMDTDTGVYLAYTGSCGEELGHTLLNYMLKDYEE